MKFSRLVAVLSLGLMAAACSEAPSAPADVGDAPALTLLGGENPEGAIVLNKGNKDFTGFCNFGGVETTELTAVRNPNGRGLLSCHWDSFDFPPQEKALIILLWIVYAQRVVSF